MPKRNRNNMPEGFEPPVPAWAADWSGQADSLTTSIFAVQGCATTDESSRSFTQWAASALYGVDAAPEFVELAQFTDLNGIVNTAYIAYWRNDNYVRWWANSAVADWWASDERLVDSVGYWRESYVMPIERLETLHSTDNAHGVARLAPALEGPVAEHAYPGAARDRIEISGSTDVRSCLAPDSVLPSVQMDDGKRVRVTPPANMCVIRSGQDWAHCSSDEREFYLGEVHPTLVLGMDYLAENPVESRCMSMRLLQMIDTDGEAQEQTCGLGYAFDILAFEEWAKTHPTHLKIFGTFMRHAEKFAENMQLRLWHEVSVLADDSGQFEYINCHAKTGLLKHC